MIKAEKLTCNFLPSLEMHALKVFDFAKKLASKLPEAEKDKFNSLCQELISPLPCWEGFLKSEPGNAQCETELCEDNDDEETGAPVAAACERLETEKKAFNKPTGMLLDLLLKVMSGFYLADLRNLAKDASATAFWKAMDRENDGDQGGPCELVKDMRVIVEQFEGNQKSVSLREITPQISLLKGMNSVANDPDQAAERDRQWKVVQGERRKYVSFSIPKDWKPESLASAFRASGKVFAHTGVLNTSHRLICASADLFREEGATPWAVQSKPGSEWSGIVDFVGSCTGGCDFVMLFDGRMREVRRLHESWHATTSCCGIFLLNSGI